MKKETIKYDKQFKQTIVNLLESGQIASMEEARRKFKIGGSVTIQKWMRQLKREDLIPVLKMRRMRDEMKSLKDSDPKLYDAVQKTIAA
jgi:transposase-like protein